MRLISSERKQFHPLGCAVKPGVFSLMVCHRIAAGFVLRDRQYPEREICTPEQFYALGERYEEVRPYTPECGRRPLQGTGVASRPF